MKLQQAPQPVLAKLLALDTHAETLADLADDVASKLEYCRALLNGRIEDARMDLKSTQLEFERLLKEAPQARKRADDEQRVLSNCKLWLDQLPHNSGLEFVHIGADGLDLGALRNELAACEREISALRSAPVAASDVNERVERYVSELAHGATPLVRGFGPGEQLQLHWPEGAWTNRKTGQGFSRDTANPLLLIARLFPDQLANMILAEITVLTEGQDQRPARITQLEEQRAQLQRIEEALIVKALAKGEPVTRDPAAPPWAVLEVQLKNGARDD